MKWRIYRLIDMKIAYWPGNERLGKALRAFIGDAGLVKDISGAWHCTLTGLMTDMARAMRDEESCDAQHRHREFTVRLSDERSGRPYVEVGPPETGWDDFTAGVAEKFAQKLTQCTTSRLRAIY